MAVPCLYLGGKAIALASSLFTLSWTHSVEKTRWEEEWRLTPAGLELVEARVSGSGAGMEPGDGAMLENGVWKWKPRLAPQERLRLARSGATGEGWKICSGGECRVVGARADGPAEIRACRP